MSFNATQLLAPKLIMIPLRELLTKHHGALAARGQSSVRAH